MREPRDSKSDGFSGDIADTDQVLAYVLGDERARYGEAEYDLLRRGYETSREMHAGQKRASGQPYIAHCIEAARMLCDWRVDPAAVCAALLHDVLEDSELTIEQLKERFPTPIPELVDGVTNISKLKLPSGQERQIESLRKLILAMSDDVRVTLIKLADRLHNMRTLRHLDPQRQQRIARITLDIYAPLAHRLGMMRVRSELEDLSFRYLWPEDYFRIAKMVELKRDERERHVKRTVDYISKRLKFDNKLEPEIHGRSKHLYSIFHKMRAQGLEFEELFDLLAVRIICQSIEECYDILGSIHQMFPPVPKRFKDYIAMPKENMYQSLHTTVMGLSGQVTEIQIRTREMHRIAEYGVAAHWKYKSGHTRQSSQDPKLLWLRRLTEWLMDVRDPKEFMSALRHEVFSDSILVFTPRGDVVELPAGSTPVDFAFSIHTEVGYKLDGAKVNGRVMPLKSQLKNGDVVEIITRATANPSVGWLEFVKTSRARSKIRHYLRSQNQEVNIQRGHEALQRALKSRGITVPWSEVMARLTERYQDQRFHSANEVLSEIGFGSLKPLSVVQRLYPPEKKNFPRSLPSEEEGKAILEKKNRLRRKRSAQGVVIQGIDESVINFAKCCQPLPGDEIYGFITVGRGVTIHKKNCGNLRKSLQASPEKEARLLSAQWDEQNLPVRTKEIHIICSDRQGLLADICNLMAKQDVFIISSTSMSRKDGRAAMRFTVEVRDSNHLNNLLTALRSQPDVISCRAGR